MGPARVWTANPENVKHILLAQFPIYPKGDLLTSILYDFLGTGIFNSDGANWKFQRKLASHEFNTNSLRKFIEDVVKIELFGRLIPILETTADRNLVLDLQDILQRFGFDNICKISFGFDPAYLSPSLNRTEFVIAFEDATQISSGRFYYVFPLVWKFKRFFNVGSEKRLRQAISTVLESARKIIRKKTQEVKDKSSIEATDLLSRFLRDDHLDDDFIIDIVISFILAGQDSTSAALTWFFWLISYHPKKGMRVIYSPYAMGRMENLRGSDWSEFKPERWLEIDKATGKLHFVAKDSFTYPVFQAAPRICLGKEMAFLQMKMLVVEILRRFQVVPAEATGFEPIYIFFLTSKMKGGFPVKIQKRN
ncbi:hypothetical protein C5167_024316 [Papaver somniferum]|uniref:Cytochrome P450 n=1 Tax=Papaver somniferum TaxID=3469 RepID=A0A4Y7JN93_PAPSO|nr:hypothetical protein C5167_024316 [Papaver somniferum]